MSRWLTLILVSVASLASAQEKIFVVTPAINAAVGPDAIRASKECVLDEIVANDVFKAVQGRIPDAMKVTKESDAGAGKLLRLVITELTGWAGGGWTLPGSRYMEVRGELVQGGQVLRTSSWRLRSRGGMAGPLKGSCAIYEDISSAIAPRVAAWTFIRMRPTEPGAQPPAEERKDSDGEKK